MIKPKSHLFKVKVMLNKLEAVNNKVASRCHAILKIGTIITMQTMMNFTLRPRPNSRRTWLSSTVKSSTIIIHFITIRLQGYTKTSQC